MHVSRTDLGMLPIKEKKKNQIDYGRNHGAPLDLFEDALYKGEEADEQLLSG